MNWKKKALAVAGTVSVTAVEVAHEKKLCRWSSAKQQHHPQAAINSVGSSSSSSSTSSKMASKRKDNQSEESLRTIMYLSCWGPN
ncbi:hypothetical protein CCACVL1_03906 [Corchorus capsularis]|uniref:Uncharacterized protein n=1 Tax=Corchorus capsularis TaxID=210143 RepID=A0A1R3JWH7_COCAP|nr:hypothetical protein CCACVL1_03906 [Corchorus capsularis]